MVLVKGDRSVGQVFLYPGDEGRGHIDGDIRNGMRIAPVCPRKSLVNAVMISEPLPSATKMVRFSAKSTKRETSSCPFAFAVSSTPGVVTAT